MADLCRGRAATMGSEVPAGDFRFRVHSVFAGTLNLAVAGQRGLVSLAGAGTAERPRGIRLETREAFDSWPVTPGMDGRREGAKLVFAAPGGGVAFTVDLGAAGAAGRRRLPHVDPGRAGVRRAWTACVARLEELQAERDTDLRLAAVRDRRTAPTPMGRRLAAAAHALGDALRRRDPAAADAATADLVGLGPGLTPAGDDFLCGVLAALRCASRAGDAERRFLLAWGRQLAARSSATTIVAATYLESALAGAFSDEIHALVRALAAGDAVTPTSPAAGDAVAALEKLGESGHSSGLDTATGLLFGLWLRRGEEARQHAP